MKLLMDFLSSSCNPYQWHLFQRLIYLRVYGIRPGQQPRNTRIETGVHNSWFLKRPLTDTQLILVWNFNSTIGHNTDWHVWQEM